MNYYLTCRSLTYAQRLSRTLDRAGIRNTVVRTPSGMSSEGCGYSVRIREELLSESMRVLRYSGMPPRKVFRVDSENNFQEVSA